MKLTRRSLLSGAVGGLGVTAGRPRGAGSGNTSDATERDRLATAVDRANTPHMSGWGLGYLNALHFVSCIPNPAPHLEFKGLNALHFVSCIPNPAPHLEFKGLSAIPFECDTSPLTCVNGFMRVPSGPGFGIDLDPGWVAKAQVITSGV